MRIATIGEPIEVIKTLAMRRAPTIGVSGSFGVALAALAHLANNERLSWPP
ncbi:hypothetical protein [Mycobacterium uberis]|uniref:hypothetical protein n=1 Tax=Mycobacterium uberis TaxID=2162698 RepID=UPI001403C683|nr:hypothetical protein [Mycobacterium uberis]